MNYTDASNLLPLAQYIYFDVSAADLAKIKVAHYVTYFDEKIILGTLEPIKTLADKELTKQMKF
jgi:hypothetical protein